MTNKFSPKSILLDAITELDSYVEHVGEQIERATAAIEDAERKREVLKVMLTVYE